MTATKKKAKPSKTRARMRTVSRVTEASIQGRRHRALFDDVQAYCQFIGYPRSGHSLVGSLLDAHPNIVIANELDALRYLKVRPVGREGLFWLILGRDREFTQKGRRWTGYDYAVPNQWQGRYDRLRVVGDKKGGGSTVRLGSDPDLLPRLQRTVEADVKLVHVVRNPFDNIATMSVRGYGMMGDDRSLGATADAYFSLCETNERLRRADPAAVIDVRHDELIREPLATLAGLCTFLGVETSADYLADCAGIIHSSPHKSRTEVTWDPGLLDDITTRMKAFEFLDGYTFDA